MMTGAPVVITGIGPVSAIGCGKHAFWESLVAGRHGFGPITRCDVSASPSKIGAEVRSCNSVPSGRRAPARFQAVVLDAVASAVLADGAIDDSDVRLVRRVVHGAGSGGGRQVDRAERQLLVELSARAASMTCSPLWRALLLEAGLPA